MKYVQLGNSDLSVSRICLGCMGFGDPEKGGHAWTLNQEDTTAIISHALDQGINFFDTAIAYQGGTSEQYVGKALKQLANRQDIVVATKFLPRSEEERHNQVSAHQHIEQSLNTSLTNLGMDYVDLYIYHMWDYHTPMTDIMHALDAMVKAGKTRYIGISNAYAYQIATANAYARANNLTEFISIQGHYNLIFREEEREMNRFADENNIALTPYSALASGRLSRLPGDNASRRMNLDNYAKSKYQNTADQDHAIILRVHELAEKHHVTMTEISLAWLLTKVTAPVVGATKVHHIDGAVAAVDLTLSAEEIQYLEELYPPHPLVGVMADNH
ncbi:aldo/keto reductase [Aerococcus urinaeequi]|uniref:aldo/keto reductase n=1 Tax=Aerococcus sp. HMSC10H05 TaxID=1581084 RepID=UPI0008A58BAD|nr:aldo/keto reductase [Aerococcus sp. HMSC10H05]OFU51390.1 oxidoreductase [Aerococcus sp. HMSC10H05]